jgi:hypothetical protein
MFWNDYSSPKTWTVDFASDENLYSTYRADRYRRSYRAHNPIKEHLVNDYVTGRSVWVYQEHDDGEHSGKIGVRLGSDEVVYYPNEISDADIIL